MNIKYDEALNNAAWNLVNGIQEYQEINALLFNNLKDVLKRAIEVYLTETFEEKTK